MKKVVSILILLLVTSLFFSTTHVFAGVDEIIGTMTEASNVKSEDLNSGIAKSINDVIGLLQIAGTGIALIVVTILGIKYMLASPSEKADTKKQILPILIGCVLVFGAVTLVSAMTDLAATVKESVG